MLTEPQKPSICRHTLVIVLRVLCCVGNSVLQFVHVFQIHPVSLVSDGEYFLHTNTGRNSCYVREAEPSFLPGHL